MKVAFFILIPVLLLTSCQVPSTVSRGPSLLPGGEFRVTLPPLIVGLENPTWGSVEKPKDSSGWSREIDDTYTRVKTSRKVIAITFDDGPHPENTPRLLDMLKEREIKATFYVVGNMVKYNPQLLRRMIEEGHEIGNHTVSHGNLARMSDEALLAELRAAHDQIMNETGVVPRTMRPPGGAIKSEQKKLMMEKLGYPTILWSVDPEDWKRPGPAVVTSRLVSGAAPGGILLVHDLHKPTVDAMPSTFDQLLEQGYEFVTVTELIELDETVKEPEP